MPFVSIVGLSLILTSNTIKKSLDFFLRPTEVHLSLP